MTESHGAAAEMKRELSSETGVESSTTSPATQTLATKLAEPAELVSAGFAMATREGLAAAARQAAARPAEALRKMQ